MNIAYLIPTYPMPSQTFIRREISALEAQGVTVDRFAARRFEGHLADAADRAEQDRTCHLLDAGFSGLAGALLAEAVSRPGKLLAALALAVRLGRRAERGLLWHLIYLAEACLLRRRLSECGAGHLHVHFGTNAASVALLCRRLGGPPYSITIHGPEEFDAPRQLSLHDKIRHASFIVAISQFTRSQLYRWAARTTGTRSMWCIVGWTRCFCRRTPRPVPERPRLVNVGRLSEQKGQLLLDRGGSSPPRTRP